VVRYCNTGGAVQTTSRDEGVRGAADKKRPKRKGKEGKEEDWQCGRLATDRCKSITGLSESQGSGPELRDRRWELYNRRKEEAREEKKSGPSKRNRARREDESEGGFEGWWGRNVDEGSNLSLRGKGQESRQKDSGQNTRPLPPQVRQAFIFAAVGGEHFGRARQNLRGPGGPAAGRRPGSRDTCADAPRGSRRRGDT